MLPVRCLCPRSRPSTSAHQAATVHPKHAASRDATWYNPRKLNDVLQGVLEEVNLKEVLEEVKLEGVLEEVLKEVQLEEVLKEVVNEVLKEVLKEVPEEALDELRKKLPEELLEELLDEFQLEEVSTRGNS